MKALSCTLALALLGGAAPSLAAEPPASLTMNCPARHLPKEADVVRVFDQHNLGEVYELRQRVLDFARHECGEGAERVEIVAAPDALAAWTAAPAHPSRLALHANGR